MAISLRTHKMLWGRSANLCAICRTALVVDATETDDESIIGDECHIVAESEDGPRGDSLLTLEQRNKYHNLILLCKIHHKVVDDQHDTYTVEKLTEIKVNHEKWVVDSLKQFDPQKQHDDEIYAAYVEEWEKFVDLENWLAWSSHVMSGHPYMLKAKDEKLEELRTWLLARIWPKRYPGLEGAFENFRLVLQDFQEIFRKHAIERREDYLITEKFYRIPEWNPELYDELSKKYEFHVALVDDLMLELTRAGNYLCDQIRLCIFPSYRLDKGVILIMSGPYMMFQFKTHRVEYKLEDIALPIPYPGLKKFLEIRKFRGEHFGEGTSINDPAFGLGSSGIEDFFDDPLIN